MILVELKRRVLAESKADVIKKYPDYSEQIETAFELGIKSGHLPWVVAQLIKKEPFNEIVNTIKEFYKAQSSPKIAEKDLLKYERLADLRTAIENSVSDRKKKIAATPEADDYEKIYEDGQFLIVFPTSKQASCKLGQGTQWCVAATQSQNYFDDYAQKNVFLYFVIKKGGDPLKNPMDKIAFAFHPKVETTHEIFDAQDRSIELRNIDRHYGEQTTQKLFNIVYQDAEKKKAAKFEQPAKVARDKQFEVFRTVSDLEQQKKIFDESILASSDSVVFEQLTEMFEKNPNLSDAFFDYVQNSVYNSTRGGANYYNILLPTYYRENPKIASLMQKFAFSDNFESYHAGRIITHNADRIDPDILEDSLKELVASGKKYMAYNQNITFNPNEIFEFTTWSTLRTIAFRVALSQTMIDCLLYLETICPGRYDGDIVNNIMRNNRVSPELAKYTMQKVSKNEDLYGGISRDDFRAYMKRTGLSND